MSKYRVRLKLKNNKVIYQVCRKIWVLPIVKVVYETNDIKKAEITKNNLNFINKTT